MKTPTIEKPLPFSLSGVGLSWEERRQEGKALRRKVPRESHAQWKPGRARLDPLDILHANNRGRQAHLVPLRMGRMAASPFAFLRGSAPSGQQYSPCLPCRRSGKHKLKA
jgi:Uncharacterized protein conserved in bacteria (DUF2252)